MKKIYLSIMLIFTIVVMVNLYKMMFTNQNYQQKYEEKTTTLVKSLSTPRGRILDCKGRVLVDNVGIKGVVYRKMKDIKKEDELTIAYELAKRLEINQTLSKNDLKKFWLTKYPEEGEALITLEEKELLEKRKLTTNDLYLLKLDRITDEQLSVFDDSDKKAALIYQLMNNGYSSEAKIIKLEVSEEEYARVLEASLPGVTNEMYFKRTYPYGNSLKSLFGTIGSIPEEEKQMFLDLGYALNDTVGISYLEKQYEEYLKGEKDIYKVKQDGTLELIKEGKKGNDLILSIDIEMQQGIEAILKEEIKKGKKLLNTEYYNGSYVIIGDLEGNLKAMVGLKYLGNDTFKNVETDIINASFTMGSVVKGASMAMAYQNNLIEVGKKIKDSCVKLYLVPEKCSYKNLGIIDDITALKTSSNYYQFLLAIKLAGYQYSRNMKMNITEEPFNIYREAFASFGLGVKTGIDLPNESTGIKGKKIAPDLLLNFSIGQYDTYTPLSLLQYINTIYNNGIRYNLRLANRIEDENKKSLKIFEKQKLSEFDLNEEYFNRIKEGLYQVVNLGTGSGYVDRKYNAVGKTGTSESLFDSNGDGKGDVETITNSFAMYAPRDNPKYSMVVLSPNVSHYNGKTDFFAYINRYISNSVSEYVLENY